MVRAHDALPFVSFNQVRLVNTSLLAKWLDRIPGFPLTTYDDGGMHPAKSAIYVESIAVIDPPPESRPF